MERRLGLAFDRCYDLDEEWGPTERPRFLSPAGLAAAGLTIVIGFGILLATPYWSATAARPPDRPVEAAPPINADSGRMPVAASQSP